jgi:hypothetical protein
MIGRFDSFNAGFGVCFKNPRYNGSERGEYVHFHRSDNNFCKLFNSIPIFALVLGINRLVQNRNDKKVDPNFYLSVGERTLTLRSFLYGSVLGIPVGVALDLVGMVTQVKYAIDNRPKSSTN